MSKITKKKWVLAIIMVCFLLIPIVSLGAEPDMTIHHIDYPSELIPTNQDFGIAFTLENMGDGVAYDVKVSVVSQSEDILSKSTSIKTFDKVKHGEPIPCHFYFNATTEAKNKNYMFEITVSFREHLNEEEIVTQKQYIGVNVVNYDTLVKEGLGVQSESLPKVIVENYTSLPEAIEAGEPFDLTITLHNTSKVKTVSNMGVSIDGGAAFVPVDSGNMLYIDQIKPNQTVDKVIRLLPLAEATTQVYPLTIITDYDVIPVEKTGQLVTATATSTISLFVTQPVRIRFDEIRYPEDNINAGEMFDVSVDFYNLGREMIYNVMAEIKGDLEGEAMTYFIGNLEAGASSYYDTTVTARNPGKLKAEIILTYEDKAGNQHEITKPFESDVLEGMPEMEGMDPMNPMNGEIEVVNKGMGRWTLVCLITGVLVVGIIVTLIIVCRRKAKKKGR